MYASHCRSRGRGDSSYCPWQPSAGKIASDKEEIILGEIGCRLIAVLENVRKT
jgi:hypothetical protein